MYKSFPLLLILLSGCVPNSNKETHYVKESTIEKVPVETTKVVSPDDDLLKHPCRAIPAGDSLIDLAVNYNRNVKCIGLYREQLNKIKDDVKDKQDDNSQ